MPAPPRSPRPRAGRPFQISPAERRLFDGLGEAAIFTDLAGAIACFSRPAVELYGWDESEVLGRAFSELALTTACAQACDLIAACARGQRSAADCVMCRKDGSMFVARASGAPYHDRRGRLTGVALLIRDTADVGERAESARRLVEVEALYRIGASLATELDEQRLIQLVTDEATALTGADFGAFFFNVQDERGHAFMLYTLSGAPKEAFARFPLPRATPLFGPTFRGEEVLRIADVRQDPRYGRWGGMPAGHLPVVSYLAVPVITRAGKVLGGLFFGHAEPGRFTETAERIVIGIAGHAAVALENARLYTELRRSEARAREADRAKDEFLAMLGHELRNPLAPIVTSLQLLRLRGQRGRELDIIERQVGHVVQLVDDLLDVARIIRGRLVLRRQPVEIAAVLERAIEMASPLVEQRGHYLRVAAPSEGLAVDGDPTRLAQVVSNLLTNAAKYTDPGGHIDVSARRDGDRIAVSVRDDGIGIRADALPSMFDAFMQGPRTIDRGEGGLGLGLTLVRGIVELHGGAVEARSPGPGQGSEFVVRLPAAQPLTAAAAPEAPAGASSTAHPAPVRVLVVDDNRDAAETLAEALRLLGYEVAVAEDGPSALALVGRFRPAVALLDIGLPVMDGYELAGRLREQVGADLRLFAITGYGHASARARAERAGFEAHLIKPVDLAALARALTRTA